MMRLLRFRIWHLLVLVSLICCILAFRRGHTQKQAVALVAQHGGYVVYENRKYEYDWDNGSAAENLKPAGNQPYSDWQQAILDPNHYNDVVAVKFGQVLIEDMQQAERFGHAKMLTAMGRDFESDGPIVMPFNDVDDAVFEELLRAFPKLRKLQYLDFGRAKITNKYLDKLAGFKNLRELRLEGCRNLTRKDVDQLRENLPSCKITFSD